MRTRNIDIIVYDEGFLDKFITICEVQQFDYTDIYLYYLYELNT